MPDNRLVKLAPAVNSLAQPVPELLLLARLVAQQDPDVRSVFIQAKGEKWSAERLAVALEEPLQSRLTTDDPQKVFQVARYLADEYEQMGDTMLLIDRKTGRAIGRITDEDVWTPAPVPREDGTLAQPLPRLKPELEAFLVMWHFEKGREAQLLSDIAPGLHPTDLIKQEGDPRLLPVTRAGRTHLVAQLREELPNLLGRTSGGVGQFLSHFDIRESDPSLGTSYEPLLRCTAVARSVTGIQDPKAMNLRFNRLGGLCGTVGNSWGREIARTLAVAAKTHFDPMPKDYTHFSTEDMADIKVWSGDSDILNALIRDIFPKRQVTLPVDHTPLVGLCGKAGAIVVRPDSYECQGRELFDRWEVVARFEFTLWVDWAEVRVFDLTGIPVHASPAILVGAG
jgi:hypothetical protein